MTFQKMDDTKAKRESKEGDVLDDLEEYWRDKDPERIPPVDPEKYQLKRKRSFVSNYQEMMKGRAEKKKAEEEEAKKEEEHQEYLKHLKPPTPDPLLGYRTHAWVMVLPGKRE